MRNEIQGINSSHIFLFFLCLQGSLVCGHPLRDILYDESYITTHTKITILTSKEEFLCVPNVNNRCFSKQQRFNPYYSTNLSFGIWKYSPQSQITTVIVSHCVYSLSIKKKKFIVYEIWYKRNRCNKAVSMVTTT